MIKCVCDICKRDTKYDDLVRLTNQNFQNFNSHLRPFFDKDVCKPCWERAHTIGAEEWERAAKLAGETTMARILSEMVP